jgi:hypothetical protein
MQYSAFPVTTTMVKRVYEKYDLWQYRVELSGEPERHCRYEADQVNLIWHADLHQFSRDHRWLVTFLDDVPCLLVGAEFLKDKKTETVAWALQLVLNRVTD